MLVLILFAATMTAAMRVANLELFEQEHTPPIFCQVIGRRAPHDARANHNNIESLVRLLARRFGCYFSHL